MVCIFEEMSRTQSCENIYHIEKQQKEHIENQSDLEIAGLCPFVFRRFYDFRNKRSGCLGRGWFHNYEVFLDGPVSQKTLMLEGGKEEVFRKLSNGTYMSLRRGAGVLLCNAEGFTYCQPDGCCYYFNPEGLYERQVDTNGNELCLQYEEKNGRVLLDKVILSTGEGFAFIYDNAGYLKCVVDHSGRMVSYDVQMDLLQRVAKPSGAAFTYDYTPEGKLARVINPEDVISVENIYDDRSRIIKQCFPDGGSIGYAYDEEFQVTVTERSGEQTIHIYDEQYRHIAQRDNEGEVRYTYNSLDLKTSVTDKLGHTTKMDYDSKGNRVCITNALGIKTQIHYNALNKPAYVVVDGVCKIRNCFDENGYLAECRNALNHKTRFIYNQQGLPVIIRQADKSYVYIAYDQRGNILFFRDAVGSEYHYVYNSRNQVVESIDERGNSFCYTYDLEGNIKKIINPNGDVRTYTYDQNGKVTEISDFDGGSISWEYNIMNLPVKVTDKAGKVTNIQYDAMGNLCRVVESGGLKNTFTYNEHNRLVRIESAQDDVISFAYDATGNPIRLNFNKTKAALAYDVLGRLIHVKEDSGDEINYMYNADNRVIKADDGKGYIVQMDYNVAGQLIREKDSQGNNFSYTYHPSGGVETITDTKGAITRFRYGSGGRLKGIIHPDKSTEYYIYNPNGNLKAYIDTQGFQRRYSYDKLNQITRIEKSKGEAKTYDAVGNITEYAFNITNWMVKVQQYEKQMMNTAKGDGDLEIVRMHNERKSFCNNITYQSELLKLLEKVTDKSEEKRYDFCTAEGQLIQTLDKNGYLKRYGNISLYEISHIRFPKAQDSVLTCDSLRQLNQLEEWLKIFKKIFHY